jgi:tektin-3
VPETWARFSNNNIQRSQAERHASHDMRNRIEQLLNKAANLTLYYWNKVNNAFTEKIREQVEARNHLQTHLSKVRLPLPLMRVEH